MKTHRQQSFPAAEEASAPEAARDPQKAALEAARAEFWEAWQAKQ